VNADRLAKLVYPAAAEEHSYEAALLVSGASFCFETVFSHPSKIDFTARAKALGYTVIMVLIHLEQAELNAARVAQTMLNQVKTAIPLCDEVRVLDNSSAENPFRPLMTIKLGQVECHQHPLPAWATQLLA
jgi:predicted ABC-type ATPase